MDGGCKASGFLETHWMRHSHQRGLPILSFSPIHPCGVKKSRVAGLPEFVANVEAACTRRLESHRTDLTL